jgi:23S rRNA (adenine2030-N6)-methyltransferase
MNYRHEFHAGNFADVLKHIFLTRILLYLCRKDKPFRYIDTHAGAGLYDLNGPEAARSNEARDGIGRLLDADLGAAAELLEPFLAAVRAAGAPNFYPGSPVIAQKFLRASDKAIFCEMLPEAAKDLRRSLKAYSSEENVIKQETGAPIRFDRIGKGSSHDYRVKTIEIDGYQGLKAFTPPPERRGLALIDPPYERRDEYERIFDTLREALNKWAGGIFMIWQPVKEPEVVEAFCRAVAAAAPGALRIDLQVETPAPGKPLARTGLVIVNPPYVLEEEARIILPVLTRILARGPGAEFSLQHFGGAKVSSS